MRMLLVMVFVGVFASAAQARVWSTVYRCDEKTPLAVIDPNYPTVYRDVMVGTHLVIVISSDTAETWSGVIGVSPEDMEEATLDGRGYVAYPQNYLDSCLAAAGEKARVLPFYNMSGRGYQLWTTNDRGLPDRDTSAGDWFIFDYHARQAGLWDVFLLAGMLPSGTLVEALSFAHVPSRDFNGDATVDFADFSRFSSQWRCASDPDPNSPSAPADLNSDHQVDLADLVLFNEYWLERTGCETEIDPNEASGDI